MTTATDTSTDVDDDQVAKRLGVGKRFGVNGFAPKRPVALFNSLSGCVVEVVESDSKPAWAGGGALWVDIAKITGATLGNVSGFGHTKTAASRDEAWQNELITLMDADADGNVDPQELLDFMNNSKALKNDEQVQAILEQGAGKTTPELLKELKPVMPQVLAALLKSKMKHSTYLRKDAEGSTAFAKHMQLRDGWNDPPGIQVRPRKGVAAMECLVANDPSGLAAKLGAALMLGVTSQLREIGYQEGKNLRGYGYDWRMPCTKMEERDGYFSKTMEDMEDLVKTNDGEKIVVVTHSLGGVHATYFFHWVAHSEYGKSKGGADWLKRHIHTFCPVAGPALGTPYGSASYLSGDEGQGLAPMVFSFADRHLVVRSWGMFGMIFPTGRHLMLQPTQSVHWVRREGLLNVHVLSVKLVEHSNAQEGKDDSDPAVAMPFYIKLSFRAPVTHFEHELTTSPLAITTEAGVDQRFQFAWTSTPDKIDSATLAMSFMQDRIGPFDKELAKTTFDLGTESVKLAEGDGEEKTLDGLTANEWQNYELKLKAGDRGEYIVSTRLQFVPHSDTEQHNDFSRSVDDDKGAWRCGGPADMCSTPEKQARLVQALGKEEGSEWRPEGKKKPGKEHTNATYAPMNIDQMMVYDAMRDEYKWWKECYADDKIWRSYSTEPPQGIDRVRPIYGIDVPTLVGNVYRRQTKRFVRFEPTTTMKLDKHCEVQHPGYKIKGGVVEEVPHLTPQADDPTVPLDDMTFNTRASGDGTVAYWSLKWPVTWRSSGVEVEPVEVGGADHRNILDKPECSMAVLSECCSHPTRYLEIVLDGLVMTAASEADCSSCFWGGLACVSTMGAINHHVFLALNWRGYEFTTETTTVEACTPGRKKKLWSRCRFVVGVTAKDLEEDRALELCVKKPTNSLVASGSLLEGTNVVKVPIGKLLSDTTTHSSVLSLDEKGDVKLKWSCRSIPADNYGMPNFGAEKR